jgi:hypothetical protein
VASWGPLAAVDTEKSLLEFFAKGGDNTLRRSVERLVQSLNDPDGVISAFSSFAE